jgi:hypothetical protein
MLSELFDCSSRRVLPEVYFIYNLVARPFGELIFLAHVFLGVRFWGLGFLGDKGKGRQGDKVRGRGARGEMAKGDIVRGYKATRREATVLYSETRNKKPFKPFKLQMKYLSCRIKIDIKISLIFK